MAKTTAPGLRVRKLADRSAGERVERYDPLTGDKILVNPANSDPDDIANLVHEPWPLAGVQIEGDAPKTCQVPTSFVNRGQAEGWLELENARPEHVAGGPADDPWRVTHTFVHADAVVLHCTDGDVRYRVTAQPGKYPDPDEPSGSRIDWFYTLKLEG